MSIKRFAIFFLVWVAGCAFIIEPAFISPWFGSVSTIDLAFNGELVELGNMPLAAAGSPAVESMDHFRVLCLLYFGLPVAVYLATQWKEL